MRLPAIADSEIEWLQAFFSGHNRLKWSQLTADTKVELVSEIFAWLELLEQNNEGVPIILPLWNGDNSTTWYACSKTDKGAIQVAETLEAFLGQTYCEIEIGIQLDSTDVSEAALLGRFNSRVIRFKSHDKDEEKVRRMLSIYRNLLQKTPRRTKVGIRPIGRVRYEFEQALLAGNDTIALACIEELSSTGRLNAQNYKFLEIRYLAAMGKWKDIVGNPAYLRSVMDLILPARTLADVIEAIYRVYLLSSENSNDPVNAIKIFRENISVRYGKLFRTRKGLNSPIIIKAFLLNELAKDEPSPIACRALFNDYTLSSQDIDYVCSLMAMVAEQGNLEDNLKLADVAYDEDDYDLALELYLQCPPNSRTLRRILHCTRDNESLTACEKALLTINKYPKEMIASLPTKSANNLKVLEERVLKSFHNEAKKQNQIKDWADWAEWVISSADDKAAEELIRQAILEWSPVEFAKNPQRVEMFAQLLFISGDNARLFFQRLFPCIYEFFSQDKNLNRSFKSVHTNLLTLLALSDSFCISDLDLAFQLVCTLLNAGLTTKEHSDMTDAIITIWQQNYSINNLDWAMDLSELLVLFPSSNCELVLKFFVSVIKLAGNFCHRLEPEQWEILELLAKDHGCSSYFEHIKPAQEETTNVNSLLNSFISKYKIGIYTLTEQAGHRAKQLLQNRYPGVYVEINNDHEATERLKNLAKAADIFVFAWRSSKHQAYYCIKAHRPEKAVLLQPKGKGSASIMREIQEHLKTHLSS